MRTLSCTPNVPSTATHFETMSAMPFSTALAPSSSTRTSPLMGTDNNQRFFPLALFLAAKNLVPIPDLPANTSMMAVPCTEARQMTV